MKFRFTRPRASHDASTPSPLNDLQQHTGSPRDEHLLASTSSLINITLPKRRSSLASFATTTRSRSKKLVHEHLPLLKSTTASTIRPSTSPRHSTSSSIASTAASTRLAPPPLPRLPSLVFERFTWTKDSKDEGDDEETLSQCFSPASTMVASPPMSSADHEFKKVEHEHHPAATPPAPAHPSTTPPAPPPAPPIIFDALNVPHVVDAIFDHLEYTDLTALRQTCTRSAAWITSYLSYRAEWTLATETSLPEFSLWHGSGASRACLSRERVAEWATFDFLSQQPEQPTRRIGVVTISGPYFPIHAFPLRCLHNARVVRLRTAALPASDTGYLDALRPGTELVVFRRLPNSWPIDPPAAGDFLDAEGAVRETPTLPRAGHRLVVNLRYDANYAGGRFRWFATSQLPQLKDVTVVFAGPGMNTGRKTTSSGAAACARGLALAPILHEIVASEPGVVYSFVGLDEFNPAWIGKTWSAAAAKEEETKGETPQGATGVARPEQNTARGSTATAQALTSVLTELMAARHGSGWSTIGGQRRVVAERVRCYTHDEYRHAVGEEQYEIDCC